MTALTTRPVATAARRPARLWGPIYAWSGLAIMWTFWTSFVVFLADPPWAREWGPPTVDGGGIAPALQHPALAAIANVVLIALFGLQHSVMARPWFKAAVLGRLPPAFERCTYVHAANMALFALILLWQPIPIEIWHASAPMRTVLWVAFAAGWLMLLLGALSFGIFDLLGIKQ